MAHLTSRNALVTGSTSGIGLAIARALAAEGANVTINGFGEAEAIERERAGIEQDFGVKCRYSGANMMVGAEITAMINQAEEAFGSLDILVNNAGIQRRVPFVDLPPETFREVQATNVEGVFLVAQAVARRMIARRCGKIINICSVMSELGRANIVPYVTAKGAVRMMTRALCAELARHNIQVNGIGPGYIETELNSVLLQDAAFSAWVEARTPAGRWGKVDELAGAAIFLASNASNFVSGHILYVDGGLTACV